MISSAKGAVKKDGHVCKLIALDFLDLCFGNSLLYQSGVVYIHKWFNQDFPVIVPKTPVLICVLIRYKSPVKMLINSGFP